MMMASSKYKMKYVYLIHTITDGYGHGIHSAWTDKRNAEKVFAALEP